jgi:hypothetical protein
MDERDIRRRRAPFGGKFCGLSITCHVRLTGKDEHKGRFRSVQKGERREEEQGGEERECEAHGFRS